MQRLGYCTQYIAKDKMTIKKTRCCNIYHVAQKKV